MLDDNHDSVDECEKLNAIQQLRCSLAGCPYRTNRTHNLARHEELHKRQTEQKPFVCPVCIYNTDKISNLKRHVAIRHPEAAPGQEDPDEPEIQLPSAGTRSCRIHCRVMGCRYETNRAYDLKRHMMVHNNVKKSHKEYKCSLCMYSSDRKANLKRHSELRHSGIEDAIKTKEELNEEQERLEELAERDILLEEFIEHLDDVGLEIEEKVEVEQPQAEIEYVYEQLDDEEEEEKPPLITISQSKPPILQGDIRDKQVIAVNVNGELRWFQAIDPPPGASSKLLLALGEQEQQAALAQQQMDELDDELALSLAEQDQEEEMLVEILTEDQSSDKEVTWSFQNGNREGKQAKQKQSKADIAGGDCLSWWDDGKYTNMQKNQTFRDLRRNPSKATVQRILRDIYDIYYKPFKEDRKQFDVFPIKDSWLCATRLSRMQIIKDMYSKQGT